MKNTQLALAPQTATLILACPQHYNCKFLPKRCLASFHLNRLATWIGQPVVGVRRARSHQSLAAHIAVLYAAELLNIQAGYWVCTPTAFTWLAALTVAPPARTPRRQQFGPKQ